MAKDNDQLLKVFYMVNLTLDEIYNEQLLKKIVSIILVITAIIFILGIYFSLFTSTYGILLKLIIILVFVYLLIWLIGIRCRLSGCQKK